MVLFLKYTIQLAAWRVGRGKPYLNKSQNQRKIDIDS